jgi:thiol-disulfide isomerase/thioredoxin
MKTLTISGGLLLATILSTSSYGQSKPLSIGDMVPNITVSNIINSKNASLKVADFKGKLLIIDFWATWCSPCVAMLPKNDSLQKDFGGKVQFLAVSNQDKKKVEDFLEKLKTFKHINVPSAVSDTILNVLFPHQYIPYYAWISPEGRLIATTDESQVNEKNIKNIIAGNNRQLENLIGHKAKLVDGKMPFYVTGHPILNSRADSAVHIEPIADTSILYQSVLSKYSPGFTNSQTWNSTHFFCTNSAILNIYQVYFNLLYKHPQLFNSQNRWKVEIKDSTLVNKLYTQLSGQKCEEWLVKNGYNYELIWKNAKTWTEKLELFKEDLDRYFGKPLNINAAIEKDTAPSDILTIVAGSFKLNTTGGSPFEKHDEFSYVQHNLPLSHFVDLLRRYFWQNSDHPIFDETNFKENLDLVLNCKMNDPRAVNKQLAKFGLKFIYGENILTDILVIKDR